jgi:hypothetical protein
MSPPAQHRAMDWLRAWGWVAGAIGLACACGNAPEPPAAIDNPQGGGSAASTDQDILPNGPSPDDDGMTGDPAPDAGPMSDPDEPGEPGGPSSTLAEAGAREEAVAYYACTESQLVGCDYIHVTARDFEADLCVQLTLESCGGFGERQLAVSTPIGWRLASGSALSGTNDCVPGQFYLKSAPATDATGRITWDVEARVPTDLVIDVRLELSPSPEDPRLPDEVSLSSTDLLLEPLAPCPD